MTANADGYDTAPNFYNGFGNTDLQPNGQNPNLLPSYEPYLAGEVAQPVTVAQFLQLNPRINALSSVALSGSVTAGDTVGIDFVNNLFAAGFVQVATIAVSGDTLITIADRLASLINANSALAAFGVAASVVPTAQINILWNGPTGNFTTLAAWSFAFSEVATIGGSVTTGDTVSLTIASANLPINGATVAVSGAGTAGDVVNLLFNNVNLLDNIQAVSYTVLGGDTPASIATALVTAINADTNLDTIDVVASANNGVVSITYNPIYGSLLLTGSTTRTATETITLAGQNFTEPSALVPSPIPNELITIGGSASTGDILNLGIWYPGLGQTIPVSYTVVGGDTLSTIAAGLASKINLMPALVAAGFVAIANAVSAGQISVTWSGTIGRNVGFTSNVVGVPSASIAIVPVPTTIGVSYVTVGSDTTTIIATALKNAINADVIFQAAGISATSSTNAVTILYNGDINPAVFTGSSTGTETVTFAGTQGPNITIGGSATAGEQINVKFTAAELAGGAHIVSSYVTTGQTTTQRATSLAAAINADATSQAYGIAATSAAAVVSLVFNGANELPIVTAFVTQADETLTLSGTITTGDVIYVTVTNASIVGGSHVVSYTALSTDTTLSILATSLAAAINADSVLKALDFVASESGAVVDIVWPGDIGPVTMTGTVTGTTVITVAGTATSTATVSDPSGSETVTVTQPVGGSGPIIATQNFPFCYGDGADYYTSGQPYLVGYETLSSMISAGLPIR